MALRTGPIPRVALDEIIDENWGDSVAQSINNSTEAFQDLVWVPSSEMLAPTSYVATGPLNQWFRVGGAAADITVPDWATEVLCNVHLNGVYLNAQGYATYELQLVVGPNVSSRRIRRTGRQSRDRTNPDDRDWFDISWTDRLPCSAIEGDRKVCINAGRYSATQQMAVDATSDVSVAMVFQGSDGGSAGWYPGI